MKLKNLCTVALLGLVVAAPAHAIEWTIGETTTFEINGEIGVQLQWLKDGPADTYNYGLKDTDTTIEFKAETRFTDRVTGFAEIELQLQPIDGDEDVETDDLKAGLKGDWGKVQIGKFDSFAEDTIYELLDTGENTVPEPQTLDEEDHLQYSLKRSGFVGAVDLVLEGKNDDNAQASDNYQYQFTVGYEPADWGIFGSYELRTETGEDDINAWGAGAYYGFQPFSVAVMYSNEEETGGQDDTVRYGILGTYYFLPESYVTAAFQRTDEDNEDKNQFAINVTHRIFDGVDIWAEMLRLDEDDDDGDVYAVGVIYTF